MSAALPPISATLEDYLEAILALSRDDGEARVRDISERLSVHKSTGTAALKTLADKALVVHEPYGGVALTAAGRHIAVRVAHSHDVVKAFLKDVLLVDGHTAEANACRMEHVMDKDVLDRLARFAQFVRECPHADRDWTAGFEAYCRRTEQGKT